MKGKVCSMKIDSSLLMDDVWDRIEEEIHRQNRTKLSVAEQCGFDRKILSTKANGKGMYLPYFVRLCSALNVSADYLLFGAREDD